MSEDLTEKLPTSESEKIAWILTTVLAMETRLTALQQKIHEYCDIYDQINRLETNHNAPNSST